MVHRIHPILRGLFLGLAYLALLFAVAEGAAAEYSGGGATMPASRDASNGSTAAEGRVVTAQAAGAVGGDATSDARKELRTELERIRRWSDGQTFNPPLPVRNKNRQSSAQAEGKREREQGAGQIDARIDRLTGQLLLMTFKGSQPADHGSREIHSLLQSRLIAGVFFGRENIQSKAQIKELIKFFAAAGAPNRPVFAIREIGGYSDTFPQVKDFERWPSEQDVAARGDPEYAYSSYRSMGASLAALGFNMNFGPVLSRLGDGRDSSATFGNNPLQTGVFAKTFVLGHRAENVVAVPIVDGSAHSVQALKTLLVSNPAIPVSSAMSNDSGIPPFLAYNGLVRGARFCFVAFSAPEAVIGVVKGFKRGCDVLVIDGGADNPATIREQAALGLSQAIQSGELTFDALNASAERFAEFRRPQTGWAASAGRGR